MSLDPVSVYRRTFATRLLKYARLTGNSAWPRVGFANQYGFEACVSDIFGAARSLGFTDLPQSRASESIAANLGNLDISRLHKVCGHLDLPTFPFPVWDQIDRHGSEQLEARAVPKPKGSGKAGKGAPAAAAAAPAPAAAAPAIEPAAVAADLSTLTKEELIAKATGLESLRTKLEKKLKNFEQYKNSEEE